MLVDDSGTIEHNSLANGAVNGNQRKSDAERQMAAFVLPVSCKRAAS